MKRKRPILASLALALATSLSSPATAPLAFAETASQARAEERFGPEVTNYTLENGMEVVIIPDRRAPVVTHMVWYKVGAADEPPGKSGIAHYLEHLMFKGTKTVANGEFSRRIAAIGGQENAFTGQDYTGYFQRVTPQALPEMMKLEADRMANLVLTDEIVLPERDVVNEERNQRTENNPGSLLGEALSSALYQNHPYGIPIIGWQHEVNSLTKEDAVAFYDRFYTPNNAILVVAGDVDIDEVKRLAEETYGKVKRRAEPGEANLPKEPEPRAARRVDMSDARVRTPSFQRQYLVPSYLRADEREAEALDVLSEILGSGTTSRLYKALVVKDRIATSAGSWYQGSARDMTEFGLYGSPRPGTTLADLEQATDAIVAELLADGVTQEEVDKAVNRLIKSTAFAQDSQQSLARIYGSALAIGSTVDDIQLWPSRLRKVTPDDVMAAARKYLRLERSVTGTLRPEENDPEADTKPDADTKKEG